MVGITMLGNMTPIIEVIKQRLEARSYEPIIFHANGVGGATMEEMIRDGRLVGVIDYATDELTDHLVGCFHDAGPHRLEAEGECGVP